MYKKTYTFKDLMTLFNKGRDMTRVYIDRFNLQKKRIVQNGKTKVVYVIPYVKIKEAQEFIKYLEENDAKRRWHRRNKETDSGSEI